MTNKISNIIYILAVVVIMLIPFVGMAVTPDAAGISDSEKRDLATFPGLRLEDGKININYLNGMGDYFQDHFALRANMITANSLLKENTLGSVPMDKVIIGKNDWLYFEGTINDYLGRELLSERELYSITHNLSLMQEYVEKSGGKFLFTVAPNKNSLYAENMPNNYLKGENRNFSNLYPLLTQEGINTVNLFDLFENEDDVLYLKRDSHWNNKGAILAYNAIMDTLGIQHDTYAQIKMTERVDHEGDLDEMLLPLHQTPELQYYPQIKFSYTTSSDFVDNMDAWIETHNENKRDTLLMYRDSFGESLVPLFAEQFENAYFSRLVPYKLENITQYNPDYVVIEKVERSLIDFLLRPAIMPAPAGENMDVQIVDTDSTITTEIVGSYLLVRGSVDVNYIEDNSDIFVSVKTGGNNECKTYKAFYSTNQSRQGNGYYLYLDIASLDSKDINLELVVASNGNKYMVRTETSQIES